jgi:subtilisin family serine protease
MVQTTAYPGVIGVAAANSGSYVGIAAPGVDILSTLNGGVYAWADGTSMAAPHVAGVAGLAWSARPALTAELGVRRSCSAPLWTWGPLAGMTSMDTAG